MLSIKGYLLILIASFLLNGCTFIKYFQSSHDNDYAAWSDRPAANSWTPISENSVKLVSLYSQSPNDIQMFCPNYSALKEKGKTRFWVGLISVMARYESNFEPSTAYKEDFKDASNNPVISRGLLQLSIESANQRRYNCLIPSAKHLHDPVVNIECSFKILAALVSKDQVIAYSTTGNKGGARYWAVLRNTGHALEGIKDFTNSLPFCAVQT